MISVPFAQRSLGINVHTLLAEDLFETLIVARLYTGEIQDHGLGVYFVVPLLWRPFAGAVVFEKRLKEAEERIRARDFARAASLRGFRRE